MAMQESGEMYLETILILSKKGAVRSIDVSEYMGYSKPSVSRAMGLLKSGGFITVEENGHLHLTESGLARAEKIYERHTILSEALESLGVPRNVAAQDACRVEHVISDVTFNAIKEHMRLRS
ncbi:MAG: metal-dependent transcriptional regulator [Oscillospiraceae bacterium]|nr:metal-dependent transcriptional regulator [Oscillospiraceae bacterium]